MRTEQDSPESSGIRRISEVGICRLVRSIQPSNNDPE